MGYHQKFVIPHGGPCARWCTGGGICGFINSAGCLGSLFISQTYGSLPHYMCYTEHCILAVR